MAGRTVRHIGLRIAVVVLCIALALLLRPVLQGVTLIVLDIALVVALFGVVVLSISGLRRGAKPKKPRPGPASHETAPGSESVPRAAPSPPVPPDHAKEIETELADLKKRFGKSS